MMSTQAEGILAVLPTIMRNLPKQIEESIRALESNSVTEISLVANVPSQSRPAPPASWPSPLSDHHLFCADVSQYSTSIALAGVA